MKPNRTQTYTKHIPKPKKYMLVRIRDTILWFSFRVESEPSLWASIVLLVNHLKYLLLVTNGWKTSLVQSMLWHLMSTLTANLLTVHCDCARPSSNLKIVHAISREWYVYSGSEIALCHLEIVNIPNFYGTYIQHTYMYTIHTCIHCVCTHVIYTKTLKVLMCEWSLRNHTAVAGYQQLIMLCTQSNTGIVHTWVAA